MPSDCPPPRRRRPTRSEQAGRSDALNNADPLRQTLERIAAMIEASRRRLPDDFRGEALDAWRLPHVGSALWRTVEPLDRLQKLHADIVRKGRLRWAAVIQANLELYSPCDPTRDTRCHATRPVELVVDLKGRSSGPELVNFARLLTDLKGVLPGHPGHEVGQRLADELLRSFGTPVPAAVIGRDHVRNITTSGVREHWPNLSLQCPLVPVLVRQVEPALGPRQAVANLYGPKWHPLNWLFAILGARPQLYTSHYAMIVPCRFWPDDFAAAWADGELSDRLVSMV